MREKFKVKSSKFKVLVFIFLLFTVSACTPQKEKIYRKSKILMDTLITISVVSDSKNESEMAIDSAFDEIHKIEKLINFWSDDSEIAAISKNAGVSEVKVSPVTLDIIEKAIFVSEKTNGAFDATIGPLVRLWDFNKKIMPDDRAIKEKIHLVDYKVMVIDKERSTAFLKRKGMSFDTGGIAKGYAADRAVDVLKKYGITSGLVSVAGDIKAFGLKSDGKPWKVGIRNPRAKGEKDEIMATIELKDMAISTSGDYERYFILNDKRYHHLLDPKTGYPADTCQSVSVIAKDGVFTDAFSTGVFILGHEKGMKLLEEMGFDGIIVNRDGKIYTTRGLRGKIEIKRDA